MDLIDNKLIVDTSEGPKEIIIDPDDFSIDEANVEGELCKAGVLLCYYADLVAELEAKASNIRNEYDSQRGHSYLIIKSEGAKTTAGVVDSTLDQDTKLIAIKQSLINAQRQALKASNLFKAMNQKVECLKALAYRQNKQEKLF